MHELIIEDESLIALTIEGILSDCGFTSFDVASSSDEAIRAAQLIRPDLITADGQLRPGSGIDAVNAICSGTPIPVIFITATPTEVVNRMPHHPLIVKPFTNEAVMTTVRSLMTVHEMVQR
jgi:DNA-binding response OmpR family regulator